MKRTVFKVLASVLCWLLATQAQAFPVLDLMPFTPDISSSFIDVDYVGNNSSGSLTAGGFATVLTPPGATSGNIAGGSFDISLSINFDAQTASGSLVIGGTIAALGFASGSVLTGSLTSTASSPTFGAGAADPLEFLFTVTGGDAAQLFGGIGEPVGVILANSGYNGSFSADFSNSSFSGVADTFILHPTVFKGEGIIESAAGGFRFPDGTVQTTAASGGALTSFQFVGFTETRVTGEDIGALYKACQSFTENPAARMASTQEFIESPEASLPVQPAWIRPVVVGVSMKNFEPLKVDFSGAVLTGEVTCIAAEGIGTIIGDDGALDQARCDTAHMVACSVPVPEKVLEE